PERIERLVRGLEEAAEARLAAAADGPARGDALGQAAGVEGAAAVARLGADVGPGQAGDGALGVVHGDVVGLDGAAGRARGRPGLAGRGADRDPAGPGDVTEGAVVEHATARVEGGRVADPDGPVVVAGEAGRGQPADRLAARGRPG